MLVTLGQLVYEFLKIGLFSVGGGMATLPFLMELTEKYDWYTKADLTNMVAISESTPGPIGVNMATYAGYNAAGIPGAVVATLSLVAPALIIMVLIAKFLENFKDNPYVQAAFYGIRPAVAALIACAVWELLSITMFPVSNGTFSLDYVEILICLGAFALMNVKKLKNMHPLLWIGVGAILGVLLHL